MKITVIIVPIVLFTCFYLPALAQKIKGPIDLQCEHLIEPLGIDSKNPRLKWKMCDDENGARQTAYRLIVKDNTGTIIWDTKKVASDKMLVVYDGAALKPFTKYKWSVTIWGNGNKLYTQSPEASFETGMMKTTNWMGQWISDGIDEDIKQAPYFRKTFHFKKNIAEARAYIAAAGLYELYINGSKVGNHRLDPTYTRFDRRNLYVVHDITSHLKNSEIAFGVILGNGWYNHQSTAVWDFHKAPWRNRPAFCMDVKITYTDGTQETVSTDNSWKTTLGEITLNSIYTGEHVDARLSLDGWNHTGYNDSSWKQATLRAAPSQNISAQALHPIRYTQTIKPSGFKKISDTNYIYDLGINISGISEVTLSADSGTVIQLKHGERLRKDGHVDLSNIDEHYRPTSGSEPLQTDIYTLDGRGKETFKPLFNYKGFQYVEVISNKPINLSASSLTGYFMHSDVPVSGSIHTSDTIVNKIWSATNQSYLSNLFGYPTDCPQREKNGWTGDAHIAIETGLYNFDAITVYEKWMADHRDEQQPNGVLPAIIPSNGWGYHWANGPDWTSTIAIIPWNLYLFYGDITPLKDNYNNLKRYVDYINQKYPEGLTTWGLGDWVPVKSVSPVELTSSIYYYVDALILSKVAKLLGHNDDFDYYTQLADLIKNRINEKYLNVEAGIYGKGMQTELAAPLFWGIVPEHLKKKVASNLAQKITENNYKLDVGILGAKALLGALSENGYADIAYKIASSTEPPSWGWWVVNGATSLYENWDTDAKSGISLNHIMFGEIGAWLYKALGGIHTDEGAPGFKNIILKPNFVNGLSFFEASHKGPFGEITSRWQKSNGQILYTIIVPANSTATLILPTAYTIISPEVKALKTVTDSPENRWQIPSGQYQFIITNR